MRKCLFLIALLFSLPCMAETADSIRSVVVDEETGMRLRDAVIRMDNGNVCKTRWDGSFSVPKHYNKVVVSHVGYLARTLMSGEVGDTIRLFSNGVRLDEVTVYGMGDKKKIFMPMTFLDSTTGKLIGNQSRMNSGIDILGLVGLGLSKLFPGKKKSSKRAKVKKILDKY